MNSKITKELVFRHFIGKTSAMQKQMIDTWAREVDNEELLYAWLDEFEALHPEYEANLNLAIERYHHFLLQKQKSGTLFVTSASDPIALQEPAAAAPVKRHPWVKWSIAASVTILLVAGLFSQDLWRYQVHRTDFGQIKNIILSDGSLVTLNANSYLRVPRWGFGSETRNVYLSGEASFSVRHTPSDKKFIVQTARQFDVEVIGTEFNVFTRARGAKVVLTKGKICLNLHNGLSTKKMEMKPGDLVTFDHKNKVSRRTTRQPEMHTAWRGHRYIFDKTTLHEIVYLLAENYGIKAEIVDEELLRETISGTLTAKNADELLELIQGVLDIRITRQDDKIFISQNSQ